MSKADEIRRAFDAPGAKARAAGDAASQRAATARKARSLTVKTAAGRAEVDEVTLNALADQITGLITLDRHANASIIREMLPAYVASLAK